MSSSKAAYAKEQREKVNALLEKAGIEPKRKSGEKTLARKITDSTLYDGHPAARFLLVQLAVLAMSEDSDYPDDAPAQFKADKEGWCWMGQVGLSLKIGTDSDGRTVRNWIDRFVEDGVVLPRHWHDDNGTLHAEYKVLEEVVDAFQRPVNKKDAIAARPKRYAEGSRKANNGSFSTVNQPGRSALRKAIIEQDDE